MRASRLARVYHLLITAIDDLLKICVLQLPQRNIPFGMTHLAYFFKLSHKHYRYRQLLLGVDSLRMLANTMESANCIENVETLPDEDGEDEATGHAQ